MADAAAARSTFKALHAEGCFAIPNPWDVGSARALEQLGFSALATTSAGFAFARGRPDAMDVLSVEEVIEHVAEIVASVDVPVNADFQAGYATSAEGVAANVRRCASTGVAGLSIEDTNRDGSLFEPAEAVERIAAARGAIDEEDNGVLLTARAECFLVGHPNPLEESIQRLRGYSEVGADVLFAPAVRAADQIRALVEAVAPKPLNVLISADTGLSISDLAELGVRRVSVGSALSRVAWGAFLRAAQELAEQGTFGGLDGAASFATLNQMMGGG